MATSSPREIAPARIWRRHPGFAAATRARLRAWGLADNPDHHRGTLTIWFSELGRFADAQALGERVASRVAASPAPGWLDGAFAHDAWRGRVYAVRYFMLFISAGISIAMISLLHKADGFRLVLGANAVARATARQDELEDIIAAVGQTLS